MLPLQTLSEPFLLNLVKNDRSSHVLSDVQ